MKEDLSPLKSEVKFKSKINTSVKNSAEKMKITLVQDDYSHLNIDAGKRKGLEYSSMDVKHSLKNLKTINPQSSGQFSMKRFMSKVE